ncbi:MAG: hypothetical protein ACM3UU_02475 [Ignavibacteriales bacterium]
MSKRITFCSRNWAENYLDRKPTTCECCSKECESIDLALKIDIYEAGKQTQILLKRQGNSYIIPTRMLCELEGCACLERISNPYFKQGAEEIHLMEFIPLFLGISCNSYPEQYEKWFYFKDVVKKIPDKVLRVLLKNYDYIEDLVPIRKGKTM